MRRCISHDYSGAGRWTSSGVASIPMRPGRGTHECKRHADPLYRPWTDGVAERLTYASRATRKPMCPVEVSGAVPVRAALRYLRQYDSWHR
jgi:hypothetical protein